MSVVKTGAEVWSCVVDVLTPTMLFSDFAHLYAHLGRLRSDSEVKSFMSEKYKPQENAWPYVLLSYTPTKNRLTDRKLLTIFCKLPEPHIDRNNMVEAFRKQGAAKSCAAVINHNNEPTLTVLQAHQFLLELESMDESEFKSANLVPRFREVVSACDQLSVECLVSLMTTGGRAKRTHNYQSVMRSLLNNNSALKKLYCSPQTSKSAHSGATLNSSTHTNPSGVVCAPLKPVEPMLAQPCKLFHKLSFTDMCVETKIDGERLQVHKDYDTGKIVCYKRNLTVHNKCARLMPYIEHALAHVNNAVLDCEVTFDATQLHVFDLLYLNDESLLNQPLLKRKAMLEGAVHENEHVHLVEYKTFAEHQDMVTYVQQTFADDTSEGVVIKQMNGVYESRKKKWFKVKRSYFYNICSASLVVVGGWKHEGAPRITIYLLAAPVYNYDTQQWQFVAITKIKYAQQNLEKLLQPVVNRQLPDWLVCPPDRVPNMMATDPLTMPVWEIEGDFIRSAVSDSVTIRLPRFKKLRDDRTVYNASRLFHLKAISDMLHNPNLMQDDVLKEMFLSDNIKSVDIAAVDS